MSYFGEANTGADYNGFYPSAPQLIDIAAIQRLYGANMSFHTGDTTYGFNSNASRDWYEAAGRPRRRSSAPGTPAATDTFDFSGYATKQTIDLRNGAFSSVGGMKFNVSVAAAVKVDGEIVNIHRERHRRLQRRTPSSATAPTTSSNGRAATTRCTAARATTSLIGGDGQRPTGARQGPRHRHRRARPGHHDRPEGQRPLRVRQPRTTRWWAPRTASTSGLDRLDRIDLSAIDADSTIGGNQAFHFGGTTFDNDAGELIRFYHAGSNTTFIQGDVDGDDDADFSIAVTGNYATFGGFVL